MIFEVLDVGCGNNPQGTVNVDKYRFTSETTDISGWVTKCRADVIAVGEFLPFRDASFQKVVTNHTIEHSHNALLFLTEVLRVAKSEVQVKCPHLLGHEGKTKYHKQFFTRRWFRKTMTDLGVKHFSVNFTQYRCLPKWCFCLIRVPEEICVTVNLVR